MNGGKTIQVIESEESPESMMLHTPVSTAKSILGRLNVEYDHGLPKEVYVSALNDAILRDKDLIPMMIPDFMLEWMMELWDEEEVFVDEERRNCLEYLKIFGFASYQGGNRKKEPCLLICKERKEDFYFYLRSRSAREEMERYAQWEKLVTGMMYYYGFLEIRELHDQFFRVSSQMVTYDHFVRFIKCRCSLWAFGEILKDINRNIDYFSWDEVNHRETLLLYLREHGDIPYKKVDREDLVYVSDGAGIDNRWPGISEIGTLLVSELGMDYYQATVSIRTLIRMVHNSCSLNELMDQGKNLPIESSRHREEFERGIHLLYDHVPVFEYKGHSRSEYRRLFHEKQLKKKSALFTIIDGGKLTGQ